ncbi:MAG: penicillin-binding protein activator LpoB [Burkholderiales bacterium]|nr:penicillin-binding protein activator LpoB [Burkholderiales bacterium]
MKKLVLSIAIAGVAGVMGGCSSMGGGGYASSDGSYGQATLPSGHKSTVSIQDSSARIHLDTKVALNDIIAFSENLTNKMLVSPRFADAKKPPRIVVGNLRNSTHDENIRIQEIPDTIQVVLFNSGKV